MGISEIFKISIRNIIGNKLRTGLTVLGIVIGIASVIIVFSAGEGIRGLINDQLESFGGTDLIETEIKIPSGKKGAAAEQQSAVAIVQGAQVTTLTLDDYQDLLKLSNVKNGYASIIGQELVSYAEQSERASLFGATASLIEIDKTEIAGGRFYTEEEDKSRESLAVLGSKMKEKLFGSNDPLGKYVTIRRKKFKVIGIAKERGAVFGLDYDNFIFVPVRTLQKKILGIDHLMFMFHQLADPGLADDTAEQARIILRENHDIESKPLALEPGQPIIRSIGQGMTDTSEDDFRVVTMKESRAILDTVTNAVTLLLLAITAISLIVGGVGVMNIMYVIITERTAEIGLRKAVGARYNDILLQFLLEALIITLIGALAGILIGAAVSYLIALAAGYFNFNWRFLIPLNAYFTALSFALVFGLGFGLYPARKAARLDPIDALRKE